MTTDEFRAHEDLRAQLVADADSILDASWLVKRLVPADRLARIAALREYWRQAGDGQLTKLQAILDGTWEGF